MQNTAQRTTARFLSLVLVLTLAFPLAADAKTVKIPGAKGGKIALEIHRPPGFQADTAYSILVSPGEYYWHRGSEGWHEKMQALGIHSSLEIIPKGGHVMPEIANEPIFERMNRLVAEIEAP